jgi:small subunit ribosomal protein S17
MSETATAGSTAEMQGPTQAAAESAVAESAGGHKRRLIGRVSSNKMNKTVVVEAVRFKMHPKYKKYVRVRKKYKAHDENNECLVGDRVEIVEHRPISAEKRWKVARLIERPELEG